MAVMNSSTVNNEGWDKFLKKIKNDFKNIDFVESNKNSYSSEDSKIYYKPKKTFLESASSLLHELGHLESQHKSYKTDIELLIMETEAWDKAKRISKKYNIKIENNHIEDCLDSYRDWLHKRSTCPTCTQNGIQKEVLKYACINCGQIWQVSKSRFCRTYRIKNTLPIKGQSVKN
jgi:predicted RNA-binding Zn-ribbon protein involved in translation (DUF1610 family)